uniref:phosphatidate phosphatase n=1 Tax=Cyprinus carpio carpio TaxID=630221 RepID=A0A8C1ERD8_CYPCA
MNYVGQLAGQVFVQVKELYRGLNPATLSGCIDVIVVRQPDGTLQCSPFHVRFGKMGVLRSREKVVDIEINGEPVSLHMKLGENGEAFFVKETESDEEMVPSHLATSPIISEGSALMQAQVGKGMSRLSESGTGTSIQTLGPMQAPGDSSLMKKRRKRRRKSQVDSIKREDNGDFSEDDDMFPIDMSSDDDTAAAGSRSEQIVDMEKVFYLISYITHDFRVILKLYLSFFLPWNTKADILNNVHATLLYTEGVKHQKNIFLQNSPNGSLPSTPKSDSELLSSQRREGKPDNPEMLWTWGELPHAAKPISEPMVVTPRSIPPSESRHFRAITGDGMVESQGSDVYVPDLKVKEATSAAAVDVEAISASAHLITDLEEGRHSPGAHAISKTDSPSKKKDKRSRHLGSDGVYLDDITELEPEVAALYFPKRGGADPRSANQSPQSVGSSGMDSGVDSFSDQLGDLPHIAISLCGGLSENREITREEFEERAISYQEFADNPSIIDDPNLVVKIGNKYYNWTTAAPIVLAMQVFQKPLPKYSCLSYVYSALGFFTYCFPSVFGSSPATVENIMKEKMPKKGGRWWFSWRGRNKSSKSVCLLKDESSSSEDDSAGAKQNPVSNQSESQTMLWKPTLQAYSLQASLHLKDGPNDVVFSVTTQYQGTCRCEGIIYLWNWDDKIVISDIDGTITRSDTLGHILPTLGKDWTHQGIARLYHRVSQNGYKFMYCSARAIGMADMTRGYLHWVNERGTMLPMGPVLLSPSSLFSAFHREVIEKKPEKFKIECLTDIKNLFYPNTEPFYAAFGNRATDVYSYKEVGVPLNRIFTVNPKGELIQEHAKTNISSYERLCEVVDHVFPLLIRGNTTDFPCSDTFSQFTFWREQLPEVEKQDQHADG